VPDGYAGISILTFKDVACFITKGIVEINIGIQQVGGFLQIHRLPPHIKRPLTDSDYPFGIFKLLPGVLRLAASDYPFGTFKLFA
jgi:hypothetical protein